jgi:hypothetical protein
MPVVAGMIAKVVGATLPTPEELAAQSRSAASQDALKHLALPSRHGLAEALQILRPVTDQQLVKSECGCRLTSRGRGGLHPSGPGLDAGEDVANLRGGEDDRQFESGLRANQFQFGRPKPPQGFLPKKFDRAKGLGGGLAGDFLDALEMNEILAQLLDRDQVWSGPEIFGPLANTSEVSLLCARGNRQKLQIFGEGF